MQVGASIRCELCCFPLDQYMKLSGRVTVCSNAANRSMAYRFVTLVDVAYEHKVKLIIAAEGYPAALFENVLTYADSKAARTKVGKGGKSDAVVVDDNLGFAKDRTVSRLVEMSTMEYAVMHAEHNAPELLLALQEAQGKAHGK